MKPFSIHSRTNAPLKGSLLFFIFCFFSIVDCQDKCLMTEIHETSFRLINCTHVVTHSIFFIKIDLLTLEDGVVANYWNSKITRKDSWIPLTIANQFINAGEKSHGLNTNTTLIIPNGIGKEVKGNLYEWNLRLCNYETDPTGLSGLFAKCDLKFEAKIQIPLAKTINQFKQ